MSKDNETHTWEVCKPERMTSYIICGEIDATETITVSKLGQMQKGKYPRCLSFMVAGFYVVLKVSSATKDTNSGERKPE